MKGFYLDKESMEYEKYKGRNTYNESWYSIDPKTRSEKSGIDPKTGKLRNLDYYYVDLNVITFDDKRSANKYIDGCLNFYTVVGKGRWKEGSYSGKVYGKRTICFKIKDGVPGRNKRIKILKGGKVAELTVGGEVNKKYIPVEFIEKIAGIVESRL